MSDSEENFDIDISGSDSDGYQPAPKKKAAPKKAATKAAPKTAAKLKANKKKVLADKDDNADSDDDRIDQDEPVSSAGPSTPPAAAATNGNAKKKTASETYTKVRVWHVETRSRLTPSVVSSRNSSISSSDPIRTLEA